MNFARFLQFWRREHPPEKALRTKRNLICKWVTVLSAGLVVLAIAYASDTRHFMPGPITTAHGTLERCTDCHSNISKGQLGWLHAVITPSDPNKDSEACLTCHQMGEAARNPHGLELARLEAYVRRAKASPDAKNLATMVRMREAAFPVEGTFPEGVFCATCHKEHKGQNFDLESMADAQCHTCHAVQFDNFQANHPEFDSYPFRRRTRINFDHSGHFKKHFPEWRTKKKASEVPPTCANCHTVSASGGHMDIKPFEQICASCHLDQIVGVERATGPKGIAILTLPGLDVETLKEKNIPIGDWPEDAEGEIGPLMQLLIGRDDERRQMLKVANELDLFDLTKASDEQIAQVGKLAWEVKRLFHTLTMSGMPDLLKRIESTTGSSISEDLTAKLTASMPHDVLLSAQREWLPRLRNEVEQLPAEAGAAALQPESDEPKPEDVAVPAPARKPFTEDQSADSAADDPSTQDQSKGWRIDPFGRLIKGNKPPDEDDEAEESETDESDTDSTETDTEESEVVDAEAIDEGPPVDSEDWTKHGGWYRKDYAILYKPTGHADPFLRAWLELTSRLFGEDEDNLAVPAFKELVGKDAQGQCTKCHSIDATPNMSRLVNWNPSKLSDRESPFTLFSHEPHFGITQEKGCFTCHGISKAKGYLDTYSGRDPYTYVSNFKTVKKEVCASCHGKMQVREDCLLCHKYHVNKITTPIMSTKVPRK